MPYWLSLIISLPTENANTRMRTWRALKASGAAVLRDGVYLMPEQEACRAVFETVAAEVSSSGGTAYVLRVEEPQGADFKAMFDRREEFMALLEDIQATGAELSEANAAESGKKARKLRKALAAIVEIDFLHRKRKSRPTPPLQRMGLLVHFLDVGGLQPSEAVGIESVLAGMRASIDSDERLLQAAIYFGYVHYRILGATLAGLTSRSSCIAPTVTRSARA